MEINIERVTWLEKQKQILLYLGLELMKVIHSYSGNAKYLSEGRFRPQC